MEKRPLGKTGLDIAPLALGGNVFGWTIDEQQSFAVLDAFIDHGFNAIDTADVYSSWAPGNKGGESETIIGKWLKARPGMRDRVVIFTKVGSDLGGDRKGLSERWILRAAEDSLRRLGVETIDLYFSHWPDETPYAETLGAYEKLLNAGKIRSIGASNLDAAQLGESLKVSRENNLPAYQVLQPEYNLYARSGFEGPLRDLCIEQNIGVVNYYGLASGFLSGKYRNAKDLEQSARGEDVATYLNARGFAVLDALDQVSAAHGVKPAEVALAWLMASPGITAPIASATRVSHVESFARAADLALSDEDMAVLNRPGVAG
ncbi:aldo/keto reductase [Rhizobium sp. KVB221]|uniref:Aldo/keto reductase n=1 Tax=Rhizobium setariae TaxID=2801340 RepID=A0A936YTM3_9HYPH|nr:aldo/keto reductase [Rhizobium setariae]